MCHLQWNPPGTKTHRDQLQLLVSTHVTFKSTAPPLLYMYEIEANEFVSCVHNNKNWNLLELQTSYRLNIPRPLQMSH